MEEDRHTRRALDELADLFLTDSSVKADRSQPDASGVSSAVQAAGAPGPAPDVDSLEHELVGPDPVRLSPKLPPCGKSLGESANAGDDAQTTTATTATTTTNDAPHLRLHRDDADGAVGVGSVTTDPLDAAVQGAIERGQMRAEQFGRPAAALNPAIETADAQTAAPPTVQLSVEAVLMGNLPGLSGPWLTQYAQLLAQNLGPVVMLHVDDQRIDAELIEPTDRPQRAGRVPPGHYRAPEQRGQRPDLIERLDTLIEPGPAQVQAVIVHTEASTRPEALRRLEALDRWTLLCGADDAAVIAGYRLIKSLVEADANALTRRMGVMVVGSESEAARTAAQKLSAAATPMLEQPLEFVGCQRQMVPVNLRQLGRYGPTEQLWPRLVAWLEQVEPVEVAHRRPLTVSERDTAVNPPDLEEIAPPDPAPADFAAAEQADQQATAGADWSWLREAESESKPREEVANNGDQRGVGAAVTSDDDDPNLAQFLTTGTGPIAGGIVLEARCPNQPRTQLVLDQRGRLHLLRRHQGDHAPVDADTDALRSAIVDLLEARRWVAQHLELLQLTQRQCRFDPQAEPMLHLFTDRADLATALIARLGDTLRLYLLKQVQVGTASTWFCTPLQS